MVQKSKEMAALEAQIAALQNQIKNGGKKAEKKEYTLGKDFVDKKGNIHKMLLLGDPESSFPIQMGVGKIKAVLDNLEACKAFIRDHGKK